LEDFVAIFMLDPEYSASQKAVGHFEQFYESKCYKKSNRKMGCTSCHDPHGVPTESEKASFYRDRCLQCHEKQAPSCSLSLTEREKQSRGNDCAYCHMPRFSSSDIAHTAVTDHHVFRNNEAKQARARNLRKSSAGGPPYIDFFWKDPYKDRDPMEKD